MKARVYSSALDFKTALAVTRPIEVKIVFVFFSLPDLKPNRSLCVMCGYMWYSDA